MDTSVLPCDVKSFFEWATLDYQRNTEITLQPLYDTVVYRGQRSLVLFEQPMGSPIDNEISKSERETNMHLPGRLPAPKAFFCTSLSLQTYPRDRSHASLLDTGRLEFFVGSKIWFGVAPLNCVYTLREGAHAGVPCRVGIQPGQYFRVVIHWPDQLRPLAMLREQLFGLVAIRVQLNGWLARAIQ